MSNYRNNSIQSEESRIEKARNEGRLAPEDYELINQFNKGLRRNNQTGERQRENHLRIMRIVAEHRDPPSEHHHDFHGQSLYGVLQEPEAAKEVLEWIQNLEKENGDAYAVKTKTHFRTAIRMFGKTVTDDGPRGKQLPEAARIIPGGDPRSKSEKDVTPKPSEIWWWNPGVLKMIEEGCRNKRDKALIALTWDTGARPKEIGNLRWKQISTKEGLYQITVGGKNHPERDVLAAVATPYLHEWLKKDHPANEREEGFTPETAIWPTLDECAAPNKQRVENAMRAVCDRMNPDREFTLKWLRKSRASILAMRDDMTQAKLETRLGWERGSQVAAHYIARFGDRTNAEIARGDGLPERVVEKLSNNKESQEDPAPLQCPNCEKWTPRHLDECISCSEPFEQEAAAEAEADVVLEKEAKKRKKRREFLKHVQEDMPDEDALRLGVEFGELLDDNDEVIDAAEDLLDALDDD